MQELVEHARLSRQFGADERFVFLGGGNTSFKTGDLLHIKPSGTALATIQPDQFVAVERTALRRLFSEPLPEDVWEREAAVKDMVLAAVRPRGSGRPSVEAPVHEVIDYAYVYHMHPALVNGMTCARDGAAACRELFPDALWVEYVNPGYTLSRAMAERLAEAAAADGRQPQVVFLGNHGVFVGADSLDEITSIYGRLMQRLEDACRKAGVATELAVQPVDDEAVAELAPGLRTLLGGAEQRAVVCASGWSEPAAAPLSPDHIVYAKSFPYLGEISPDGIAAFRQERGYAPKVIAARGRAVFCADASLKTARETMIAARNGALVRQLTATFGGPRYLADHERQFIENWEVEAYRRKLAAGDAQSTRLGNRICVVTGAAQGFGLGIASGLAAAGGVVVLADINLEGAREAAADLNARFGAHRALAVAVNVADEESVAGMVREVVRECGGIDLFVANAGVLRAGPTPTFAKTDWDFVTSVNYTGYFLCVKHAAPVMAAQNVNDTRLWTDIVQINSKSGLDGSNRNAAYAGSKFGAIGLTQSFAKEFVPDRIKVNSICPGNYFDGPLWSDPDKGLFVQYFRAGKVPGAKTLADVRRFYEEKALIPRGCTPEDIVRTILYACEQEYETGQAIPVTGGQIMLK